MDVRAGPSGDTGTAEAVAPFLRLNAPVAQDLDFDEDDLRALAGSRSFERGRGYLAAVTAVEVGEGWITATVHGADAYQAELTLDGPDGLVGECDCPYGMEGNFCKHLVALGLTLLAEPEAVPRQRGRARTRAQELDAWLAALSRDELLALVREQIAEDRQLARRLELRAASARGDLVEVRTRIRELLDTAPFARYGYVESADAHAYGEQASQAVAAIAALTAAGRAADAISLSREAMRLLSEAQDAIDDSDGHLDRIGSAAAEARAAQHAPTRTRPRGGWSAICSVTWTISPASTPSTTRMSSARKGCAG